MKEFVTFTKTHFDKVLDEMGLGTWVFSQQGYELVYDLELEHDLEMRIYSSIDTRDYKSRPLGTDAIRVVPMYHNKSLIKKQRRVNRAIGWEDRLLDRIMHSLREVKKDYKIGTCGHLMEEREGKFGKFHGCLLYPKCKNTRVIK